MSETMWGFHLFRFFALYVGSFMGVRMLVRWISNAARSA